MNLTKYINIINAVKRFASTPVVDDDFEEAKHELDSAIAAFGYASQALNFEDLRKANTTRAEEWGGPNNGTTEGRLIDLLFRSNEIGGEAGELQNIVKKYARTQLGMPGGCDDFVIRAIADEIADTIVCCDRLAELLDIDTGEAVRDKFNKTSDKHGFKTKL